MLSRIRSAAVRGIEGFMVAVELDLANGLPTFTTVGLPDSSVREARERVVAALRNSGFEFPSRRVTVNLAPAELRKAGTQLDLPIGLGTLIASGQLEAQPWAREYCFLGELALDGSVRPVSGVLPMAAAARQKGLRGLILPEGNAREAGLADIPACGVSSLRQAAELLRAPEPPRPAPRQGAGEADAAGGVQLDLSDVRGQSVARRALEVAAAGGHNLLLVGPPGAGKSMLAARLPGLLPPLSQPESFEVTKIYSVCGLLPPGSVLLRRRPIRAPHHTASLPAFTGGGPRARPGELSLAHHGVLFLDELPEFPRPLLEALRQPLEERRLSVCRLREAVEYPADFMLVAAMNPCPCGYRGHRERACRCGQDELRRYRGKLSGPLLDRIDMQVEMAALSFSEWAGEGGRPEGSEAVCSRVAAARERALRERGCVNARLGPAELRARCRLATSAREELRRAARKQALSARALDRLLRVARTIADLEVSMDILEGHLWEALKYRALETPP